MCTRKEFRVEYNREYYDIPAGGYIPGQMGTLSIRDDNKQIHEIKYLITDAKNPILEHFATRRAYSGSTAAYFTADASFIVRSYGIYKQNENSNLVEFEFPVTNESYTFRFSELPTTPQAQPPPQPTKKKDPVEERLDYEADAVPKFHELIRTGEFAEALKVYDTIHERKNSIKGEAISMFIALKMIDKACEVADEQIKAGYPCAAFKLERYFLDAGDKPKALQWCKKYFAMKEKQNDLGGVVMPSTYLQRYGGVRNYDQKEAFAALMKLEI